MIALIDTHAHLQEPEFSDDFEAVVGRASDAGVGTLVLPAVDLDSARAGLELADRHDGVFATAGYHPHEASRLDDEALQAVEALLDDPKVVAVGEIGLDFYRMHSPVEAQTAALDTMLALAARRKMPVVIHCREAWQALADQLVPWARQAGTLNEGRPLGVLHYFSGTLEDAWRYVELGFMISVHTSVTHPKQTALRDVVAQLPLDSLVVETDSPFGAPQLHRGKRNEPAYVVEAAKQVAELHDVPLEYVAEATTANARRLFNLPAPVPSQSGAPGLT